MTTPRLALLVSASLCLSQVIWHVQANAPRDWPEHALALACGMTYNDSGGALEQRREATQGPNYKGPRSAVTYFLRMLGLPRMRATVELRP